MRKQLVISIADLRYVAIACPHCRAQVVLDMQQKSDFAAKYGVFAPKECPGCRIAYDSAIQPNVDNLQRAYQSLIEIADRISFHGEPTLEGE